MAQLRELFGAEEESEVKERLGLLQNAAESKLALFKSDLKQRIQDPLIGAGDFIIMESSGIRAEVESGLNPAIKNVADEVFLGSDENTKETVLNSVVTVIEAVLGGGGGVVSEKYAMLPIVDNEIPLILHMYLWRYSFTNKDVIGRVDNGIAYYVVKAAMKPEKFTKENLEAVSSMETPEIEMMIAGAVSAAEPLKGLSADVFEEKLASVF